MISPCTVHIPLKRIPARVIVVRDGRRLQNPSKRIKRDPSTGTATGPDTITPRPQPKSLFLQVGDQITVSRPAVFTFAYAGNRYQIAHGSATLACRSLRIGTAASSPASRVLAVDLKSGQVNVRAGSHAREGLVLSPEMLAFATLPNTNFVVDRDASTSFTSAYTLDRLIITADASNPKLRINTRESYTSLANGQGIRLNVWPFDLSPLERPTTPADGLSPFWAGGSCTVGCLPAGTIPGWPLKPFHQQHAIRAGIDELRPANFHVAVDIEANNFEPVYAIQSGDATIAQSGFEDTKITVGNYTYWHVDPTVSDGQYVTAYQTELGTVENGQGHIAFSEGGDNDYLNPLRPGGPLRPYTDTEMPVLGVPEIFPDGRVIEHAFDPQSFIHKTTYLTPVLAPAALAWRLYNSQGQAVTGLEWALKSSGYISPSLKPVIFAPGASNPGYACFATQLICIPNWVYWLAGGLTEPLPFGSMSPGRYRLTVYAWNFAGNTSALDDWFNFPLAASVSATDEFGPLDPHDDP